MSTDVGAETAGSGDNPNGSDGGASRKATGGSGTLTNILAIVAAVLSVITGLGALYTNQRSIELENEVREKAAEIQQAIEQQKIDLEGRKFDEEQKKVRHELYAQYIPKIVSKDDAERHAGIAIISVIYPKEAKDILATIDQVRPVPSPPSQPPQPAGGPAPTPTSPLAQAIDRAKELAESTGDWTIVVGTDTGIEEAEYEAQRARTANFKPTIYHRGEYFVTTVGLFNTEADAERAAISARSKVRASSFIVNLNSWCPGRKTVEGSRYVECT